MDERQEWTFVDEVARRTLILEESDICYYYLVRTSEGYNASTANSRIENFKKKPERFRDNASVWRYKLDEIERFAADVCDLLARPDFENMLSHLRRPVIAPIPPSKARSHEFYDSRMEDLCKKIAESNGRIEFENPFSMRDNVTPMHEGGTREVDYLKRKLMFSGFSMPPDLVILIDDVLLKGTHYVACRDIIRGVYPAVPIIGLFLSIHKSDWVDYESMGVTL